MSQKRMFETKCTDCGKSTTVPFKPTQGKPVYCKPCFSKHNQKQHRKSSIKGKFDMKNAWAIRGDNWQGTRHDEQRSVFQNF
jgi:CxxC-x17-CxxC domain-containing protein